MPFGVILRWIDDDIDRGNIAFQSVIEKPWEDSGESLYHKAKREIVHVFMNTFSTITMGNIPRKP